MSRGKYIVIEGLDGSGKSTQFAQLQHFFGASAIGVREPGGTPMAENIRTLLKTQSLERAPITNTFLFSAARADLVARVIAPQLQSGTHVLSDRNWLSTVAYQQAEGADIDDILQLSKLATKDYFEPDLLLFLDASPEICHQRLKGRGGSEADFFEAKGPDYFTRVREAYKKHLHMFSRAVIINGELDEHAVWQQIEAALAAHNIFKKEQS